MTVKNPTGGVRCLENKTTITGAATTVSLKVYIEEVKLMTFTVIALANEYFRKRYVVAHHSSILYFIILVLYYYNTRIMINTALKEKNAMMLVHFRHFLGLTSKLHLRMGVW